MALPDSFYNSLKLNNATQSEEEFFKQTSLLIALVRFFDGTINIPPLSTGGAIDLEVIDKNGNLVNLGVEIKDWNKVDSEICRKVEIKRAWPG